MTKSDHEKIIDAINERFYETGKLSKVGDIEIATGLSEHVTRSALAELTGNQLVKFYEGAGDPDIYGTVDMFNSITSHVCEPDWIDDYEFEGKRDLRDEVRDANGKIARYQVLELMLHAQGTPLEDGIEEGLKLLGLDPERSEDAEDFFFEHDGEYFIAEAKGKGGPISKSDINQLNGWVESKLDEDYLSNQLNGVLFHNAHRAQPPHEREESLTSHAIEYLSLYDFEHISTFNLLQLVREIAEFQGSTEDRDELVNSIREEFIEEIRNA